MNWDILIGIILSVILGGVIGLERELSGKPAGLRTNVLICVGAAVFTLISRYMGGTENDSISRIAAQIVTGIGFLGAGAIMNDRGGIHGLTTAATIWLVAGIGMACGADLYSLAVIAAIVAVFVLSVLAKFEKIIKSRDDNKSKSDSSTHDKAV